MRTVLLSSLLTQEQKRDFSRVVFSYMVQENTCLELVNDLLEHTSALDVSHEIQIIVASQACLQYRHMIQEHTQQVRAYRKKFSIILAGERANAQAIMGYCLTGNQACTIATEQRHEVSNTSSALSLRTALYDQTHVNNSSMIFVAKNCRDITTKQENKNLMLSSEARVMTKPEIDIRSSRVSCCHGATTSSINQEHIWYLKSRGIQEKDARNLIINGFLGFCT